MKHCDFVKKGIQTSWKVDIQLFLAAINYLQAIDDIPWEVLDLSEFPREKVIITDEMKKNTLLEMSNTEILAKFFTRKEDGIWKVYLPKSEKKEG